MSRFRFVPRVEELPPRNLPGSFWWEVAYPFELAGPFAADTLGLELSSAPNPDSHAERLPAGSNTEAERPDSVPFRVVSAPTSQASPSASAPSASRPTYLDERLLDSLVDVVSASPGSFPSAGEPSSGGNGRLVLSGGGDPPPTIYWPVIEPAGDANHWMLQGFGDGSPVSPYKFHEGIDIMADGQGGQKVVAARPGVVEYVDGFAGGRVTIKVAIEGGTNEWDNYLHISRNDPALPALQVGQVVAGGTWIGRISTGVHNPNSRHLHFDVTNAKPPANAVPAENTYLNPFFRFTAAADRDPLGQTPKLQDTNSDVAHIPHHIWVAKSGTTPPVRFGNQPVKGDVDIVADVRDKMNNDQNLGPDGFLGASGIFEIGYYIRPLIEKSHGVKTSKETSYRLARFDDNWFPDQPFSKGKFPLIYPDNGIEDFLNPKESQLRVKPNPTDHALVRHYIVTNTIATDGRVANVQDKFWNTNAKERNPAPNDDVATANYADDPDALMNAEARFKDGEYRIHIFLRDVHPHDADIPAVKVRLDNFKEVAAAGWGGIPPGGNPRLLSIADPTPYEPPFVPEPEVAVANEVIPFGVPVGIWGAEYLPDEYLWAYVFPHRSQGWLEGDVYANPLVQIVVRSDGSGFVPLTNTGWQPTQPGIYDVIIDYDNDGKFTWTMDGLGAFNVPVPEPEPTFAGGPVG